MATIQAIAQQSLGDGDIHWWLGVVEDVMKPSENPLVSRSTQEGTEDSSVQIVANRLLTPPTPSLTQGTTEENTEVGE